MRLLVAVFLIAAFQAETAIDTLNERIYELETSNAALSKANDELNIEVCFFYQWCNIFHPGYAGACRGAI